MTITVTEIRMIEINLREMASMATPMRMPTPEAERISLNIKCVRAILESIKARDAAPPEPE